MPRIDFSYDIVKTAKPNAGFHNELIEYLTAIDRERSLVKAAKALNVSYRTLWGKIEFWEKELGQTLVVRDQGKSSQPSELGRKLLWAEKTVQAQNALAIEQLRAQFQSVFAQACDPHAKLLSVSGCFDPWLAQLPEALSQTEDRNIVLDMQFLTSEEGLERLWQDRCDIAAFNLPSNTAKDSPFAKAFGPYLNSADLQGILFTVRTQGLATAAGNPMQLHSLIDVARKKARYANRKLTTGTGLLFQELLTQAGLKETDIVGFDRIEPSHAAVATAIAAGSADCGLCEEGSARRMGLDFTPLVFENYYLVWKRSRFSQPEERKAIEHIQAFLQSDDWKVTGKNYPGYTIDICGQTIDTQTEWPWFD
ncbi:MAG: substrate-binding domain-containing protein [Sutterellaceae bacterium]|nr:substrate-binding domain-containing protein [Sutterellaceae bacterium]